ncbi:DUF4202 domain-containing protein [Echinimonas agarilytica]|uniref:DUF4202 domain-containing protein n=1 Tax=Echinimonas agarilytica TaxID=1215918 RepID=A0AA41W8C1_9GAMM|nr:DUF4202 domain-containing protein [Echinimonas agarilytica]MCM2681090.1 DUF4202 domain-containing protein [Echinimonas agarilytica]
MERLAQVFDAIDAVNKADPNLELVEDIQVPASLLYGTRMSSMLEQFAPETDEIVQIACRAQHIKRWAIPRADFPMGKKGYYDWRQTLGRKHGEWTGEILAAHGYDQAIIDRVSAVLRKERIKADPQCQQFEDVICLVFLAHYAEDFASKHEEAKVIDILQKTWRKMSEKGHDFALKQQYPAGVQALIEKALA